MAAKEKSKAVVPAPEMKDSAAKYEEEHVHAVYDEIASHFSSTRYKPWPIVGKFMSSLAPGSIGVDLGCGNGKYLSLPTEDPSSIRTIGVDRSINLLKIAQKVGKDGCEAVLGDVIDVPWRKGIFDYAISIATIHHLATPSRRVQAVEAALKAVKRNGGRILIYVWAVEQDEASKRTIPKESSDQVPLSSDSKVSPGGIDVLVPWVHNEARSVPTPTPAAINSSPPSSSPDTGPRIYQRYYHMFAEGELQALVKEAAQNLHLVIGDQSEYHQSTSASESVTHYLEDGQKRDRSVHGVQFLQEGWERSNYYVELLLWQK